MAKVYPPRERRGCKFPLRSTATWAWHSIKWRNLWAAIGGELCLKIDNRCCSDSVRWRLRIRTEKTALPGRISRFLNNQHCFDVIYGRAPSLLFHSFFGTNSCRDGMSREKQFTRRAPRFAFLFFHLTVDFAILLRRTENHFHSSRFLWGSQRANRKLYWSFQYFPGLRRSFVRVSWAHTTLGFAFRGECASDVAGCQGIRVDWRLNRDLTWGLSWSWMHETKVDSWKFLSPSCVGKTAVLIRLGRAEMTFLSL
jgi:hypothetical protein